MRYEVFGHEAQEHCFITITTLKKRDRQESSLLATVSRLSPYFNGIDL